MEEPRENKLEERKEKIKGWFKNPYNLVFIGILIFAFAVRLYYFSLTANQPLWWDESEYMASAKGYAGVTDYKLESIRLPGFPMLMSTFFILGITSELLIRFIALFIPSLIVILLIYLCINEMYADKRIALISTLIISVLWEHLFYSNRFHTENFALIFEFIAIYILLKSYLKKQNLLFIKPKNTLIWVILFSLLAVLFRPGNLPFVLAILLFLVYINKHKFFTKKSIVPVLFFAFAALVLFFFLPNTSVYQSIIGTYYHPNLPLAWQTLSVFHGFYQSVSSGIPSVLYYAFIAGIIIFVIDMLINFEKIKRLKDDAENFDLKSDFFNALIILSMMFMMIFIVRPYPSYEFRWFFPLLTGMLAFTGKGLVTFSEYVGKLFKNKAVVIVLILLFSGIGVYTQLAHSDAIIKVKLDSYGQVKESGLWLKQNSNPRDIIVSASVPQHSYYSERKIIDYYIRGPNNETIHNETAFNDKINKFKPKYLVVSVFEPVFTPQWAYDWPQKHNETVKPVQAYYLDKEQKQLALVIYEFSNYDLKNQSSA